MTRPRYQTDEDTRNEGRVFTLIEQRWSCEIVKIPDRYELDAVVIREGLVVGFVEVKRRHHKFKAFKDVLLGLGKYRAFGKYNAFRPVAFVAAFDDCIQYYKYNQRDDGVFDIKIGGPKKPRDDQDIEPVVMIPTERFKKL